MAAFCWFAPSAAPCSSNMPCKFLAMIQKALTPQIICSFCDGMASCAAQVRGREFQAADCGSLSRSEHVSSECQGYEGVHVYHPDLEVELIILTEAFSRNPTTVYQSYSSDQSPSQQQCLKKNIEGA